MLESIKEKILENSKLTSKGFLLFSPISIFAFPITLLVAGNREPFSLLLIYGVLLTLVTFSVYKFLIILFLRKSENSKSFFRPFAITVLTGAFRGYFFYQLVELVSWNQPSSFWSRVSNSTIPTLFWLTLANFLVNFTSNYRSTYQRALNSYLATHSPSSAALSAPNRVELSKLELNLKNAVAVHLGDSNSTDFQRVAEEITNQINRKLRPLSQRIWIESLSEFPKFRLAQVFRDSLRTLKFSPFLLNFIILFLSLLGNFALRSISESIWRTSVFLVSVFIMLSIRNSLLPKIALANGLFLLGVGIIPVYLSEFVAYSLGYYSDWFAASLVTPIVPVVIIVLSIINLINQDRNLLIDLLDSGSQPIENRLESKRLASYLHNSLQSELLSLAKQLEEATHSDSSVKDALLKKVSAVLNRSIAVEYSNFASNPLQRLESAIGSWHGILEIRFLVDPKFLQDDGRNAIIVQIVEEFATNVSRYDSANYLNVTSEDKGDTLLLRLQTDGKDRLRRSQGLGSRWFDQIAPGAWKIVRNDEGKLLTIEL